MRASSSDYLDYSQARKLNQSEPPCTDPYARWCGRSGAARPRPIPIELRIPVRSEFTRNIRVRQYNSPGATNSCMQYPPAEPGAIGVGANTSCPVRERDYDDKYCIERTASMDPRPEELRFRILFIRLSCRLLLGCGRSPR